MSIINEPDDLLGLAVLNVLAPRLEEDKIKKKLENWNRTIVLEIIGLYPISLVFNNSELSIEYDEKPKYDLKITTSLNTFVDIAEGNTNLISAFLKRKVKVKKIYRIFTILKFYSILFPALKALSNEAEGN